MEDRANLKLEVTERRHYGTNRVDDERTRETARDCGNMQSNVDSGREVRVLRAREIFRS